QHNKILSDYCVMDLSRQKNHSGATEWVLKGAGPDRVDSLKFNITKEGLLFTFDEYEVDCYAAGSSQVLIPKGTLGELIEPDSGLLEFWQQK
ncbi:MAG: DUF3298 domain-containing protein, partial [Bryobacterales bacterium]|nr:DUF3298 domain-containing protein [Bryobacterales bacterium]